MLAYVFWHWPGPGVEAARYADAVVGFHRILADVPSPGLRGSRTAEIAGAPWLPVPRAFEDWYLVDDFTALGALNDAAVAGRRKDPHDTAARLAGGATASVYRLVTPACGPPEPRTTWCAKPAGTPYPAFLARLPPGELWQRLLALGPAPEFCLPGLDAAATLGGVAVETRPVHGWP
jgi:hypothetical protein